MERACAHNSAVSLTPFFAENKKVNQSKKLMGENKDDNVMGVRILGDHLMGILFRMGIALIPMVLDPHGKWGPLMENFLFHYSQCKPQAKFVATRSNAAAMLKRIATLPCPMGVVTTVTLVWRHSKTQRFYRNSYTVPNNVNMPCNSWDSPLPKHTHSTCVTQCAKWAANQSLPASPNLAIPATTLVAPQQ